VPGEVVEVILRLRDQASQPLEGAAESARKLADESTRAAGALNDADDAAKNAAVALSDLDDSAKAAERSVRAEAVAAVQAVDALEAHAEATAIAARSTGRMSQALAAVALQVPDVITQLSMGADPLRVFAIQGLQVVQQTNAMASAFSALASKGPILAVALAAVATVAVSVANAVSKMREEVGSLDDIIDDTRENIARWDQTFADAGQGIANTDTLLDELRTRVLLARGEIDEFDAMMKRSADAIEAFYGPAIQRMAAHVEELRAARARLNRFIRANKASTEEMTRAHLELDRVNRELADAEKRLADLQSERNAKINEAIGLVEQLRDAEQQGADAGATFAASVEAQAEALGTFEERLQQAAAEWEAWADEVVGATTGAATGAEELARILQSVGAAPTLSALDEVRLRMIDVDELLRQGKITAEEHAEAIDLLRARYEALQAAAEGAGEATRGVTPPAGATAAVRAAGALFGGAPLGAAQTLLGVAGPYGALAGAALGGLAALGETGAQGVIDAIEALGDQLQAGLEALPDLLEALAERLPDLVPALVGALVDAAPDILVAVVEAVVALSRELTMLPLTLAKALWQALRDWWKEIGGFGGLVKALLEALARLAKNIGESVGNAVSTVVDILIPGGERGLFSKEGLFGLKNVPILQEGRTFVERTGLALIHQGEQIVPRGGRATQAAEVRSPFAPAGGPTVVIQTAAVSPDIVPALVREMERVFGQFGRAQSPLFSV